MSDTVSGNPAPIGGSLASRIEQAASRLAPSRPAPAPPATSQPAAATPQPSATTAAPGQSETPPATDKPLAAPGEATPGETHEQDAQPAEETPPSLTLSDGTSATIEQVEQWKNGALLREDYTRKMQQVAQGRDLFLEDVNAFTAERDAFARHLEANLPALDATLLRDDPQEFYRLKAQRDLYLAQVGEMRERNRLVEQRAQAQRLHEEEQRLAEVLPDWIDPAKREAGTKSVVEYCRKIGAPPSTLEKINGDRFLLRLAAEAARHLPVIEGAKRGGEAAAEARRQQPSPTLGAGAQVRTSAQERASRDAAAVREQIGQRGTSMRRRTELAAQMLRPARGMTAPA